MKKLLYIVPLFALIVACGKMENKAPLTEADMVEAEESDGLSGFVWEEAVGNMEMGNEAVPGWEAMATEKLKDYFDLLLLEQKHPEFREDIRVQLERLLENDTLFIDHGSFTSIENIRQKGGIEQISDSVQHVQFYFVKVDGQSRSVDSITARIRAKEIQLDNEARTSFKFTFLKNH
ncbi:MAG: hypothetical protein AAFP76_09265 [Bacteroidota bacterium]